MYEFEYVRPQTVATAVEQGGAGQYLAGGMTLLPTLKLRLAQPGRLVDLNALPELQGIRVDGNVVRIGAMTRHADVARSAELRRAAPVLAELAGGIGDPHVRNRGTIGGSVANNDPAADYPAAVLGLGATVVTSAREIAGDDFFTGMFSTALAAGELIRRIDFPVPKRAAYAKFPNPASRYAMAGVLVAETAGGIRVAVTGAGPCVFRVPEFEAALTRRFAPEALDGLEIPSDGLNQDLHGSPEYRAALVTVMAQRAVAHAAARG
ncbi:MAG: xanthine dehydrogenase family protein subunit M [Steroidobacteraceae bacterium]|jgi:carbon-monoxide dehydrogenase medium subunit|nr:xanthine dehydrogenase family protein subunit M [Steroidobacteraceae bacterium]